MNIKDEGHLFDEIEYYLGDFEKKGCSIRVYRTTISKLIKSIFQSRDDEPILIGWKP